MKIQILISMSGFPIYGDLLSYSSFLFEITMASLLNEKLRMSFECYLTKRFYL